MCVPSAQGPRAAPDLPGPPRASPKYVFVWLGFPRILSRFNRFKPGFPLISLTRFALAPVLVLSRLAFLYIVLSGARAPLPGCPPKGPGKNSHSQVGTGFSRRWAYPRQVPWHKVPHGLPPAPGHLKYAGVIFGGFAPKEIHGRPSGQKVLQGRACPHPPQVAHGSASRRLRAPTPSRRPT